VNAVNDEQTRVNEYFDSRASRWQALYEDTTLVGAIHRDRQVRALEWIERLALPAEAAVLEVGCGAGLMTVELAARGLRVDSIDSSAAMVERSRLYVGEAGLGDRVTVAQGDAHRLQFADRSFRLVLGLGVLPFLHSPEQALRESARVLEPGGYALFSSDNRFRLNRYLDPRSNPLLTPLKGLVQALMRRMGMLDPIKTTVPAELAGGTRMYSLGELDAKFGAAELTLVRTTTIGFGPFSFLGFTLLPDRAAVPLHRFLQALANRNFPLLRSTGLQHVILARRNA
jgi:ubiquinone/menaquinone biosynthesis C-methylase UbiE